MPDFYLLRVAPHDANLIGQALGARPFSEVAKLIADLQRQVNEQEQAEKQESAPPYPPEPA